MTGRLVKVTFGVIAVSALILQTGWAATERAVGNAADSAPPLARAVLARQAWTNTHIAIAAGASVRITATGTIDIGPGWAPMPPIGHKDCQGGVSDPVVKGLPCWSLIGRVGSQKAFFVGRSVTVHPHAAGMLILGVNDDRGYFADNSGAWHTQITISSPVVAPTVSPQEDGAAAWAESHLSDPVGKYHALPSDDKIIADQGVKVRWSGYCLAFVDSAYQSQGITPTPNVHTDAKAMYEAYLNANLIHTTGVPPRGAFTFYPTDTSAGHIGISVGGGQEISTRGELTDYLPLQEANYSALTGYAGWAYPTNSG